jgi:nicotinamide-nucleotide amidase
VNPHSGRVAKLVAQIHEALLGRGETVAVAESLTGGLLAAAITDRPGASEIFVGSITAYVTQVKERQLGVDGSLLAARGAVDPEVAAASPQPGSPGRTARTASRWGPCSWRSAGRPSSRYGRWRSPAIGGRFVLWR